ncbi:MAG: hypothetical protein GY770_24245, partial [Aestuariibacter sp.]|nr:hypothetical protein [Aestuariibacter sp.]
MRQEFLERVHCDGAVLWPTFINADECSWHLNATPNYAWSDVGRPAHITRPAIRGQRFTLTLAIGTADSACLLWTLQRNSSTGVSFQEFVSKLPMGCVLVLDNARIHHATKSLTGQGL